MAIKFQDSLEVKGGSASKIYLEGAGGTGSSTILQAYNPDDGAGHAGGTAYLKSSGWGEAQLAVGSYRWTQAGGKMTVTGGVYYFNTGNVGIGTGSPTSKLDVNGTVSITGTNQTGNESVLLQFNAGTDQLGSIRTYNAGGYNQHTRFYTSSVSGAGETLAFMYDQLGNIGIGNTEPATDLSLGSVSHISPDDTNRILNWYSATGGDEISNTSHYITVGQNSSDTTQPKSVGLALFNPNASNNTYSPAITFGGLSTSGNYMNGAAAIAAQLISNTNDNNFRSGELTFYTQGSTTATRGLVERMRISANGNVGINEINPEHRLDIVSSSANVLGLTNTSGGTGTTITFNDNHTANQRVYLTAHHVDSQSHGGGASLHLTSTEANVTMVSERYKSIQHGDSSQWSAAYSWGDHSAVGYLRTRPEVHTALYSTGGNADEYTEFGIYRNYGEGNPPSLGHNTLLNVMQTNGNYGWQITSSTAAGGDSMWYRQKGADWGDGTWYQIASREWVIDQGYLTSVPSEYLTQTEGDARYLTSESDTLASVTGRGATTSTPIGLGGGPWTPLTISLASNEGTPNAGVAIAFDGTDYEEYGYRFKANGSNYYQVLYDGSNINWKHYSSGSYNTKMSLSNAGDLSVDGTAQMSSGITENTHYVGVSVQHWGDGGTGMYFNTDSVDIRTNAVTRIEFNNSGVSIPSDVYFTGNSRKIYLTGGDTDSQNGWVVGEQDRYGFGATWDSGLSILFQGWDGRNVTDTHNKDLGSVNIRDRVWNFLGSARLNNNDLATEAWVEEQPPAPAAASCAVVGDTIEVSFDPAPESPDYYQVWASQDGGSYSLIAQIPTQDFSPFMTVIDTAFSVSGLRAYRVYAVRRGIYSDPATTSRTYTQAALEPVNMNVVPMEESFFVQWDAPASRFVDHYEVYLDTHEDQGSLNRNNANLVYSGNNTFYMHPTSTNEFHQFWVEIAES